MTSMLTINPITARSAILLATAGGAVKGAIVGAVIGKLAVGVVAGACGGVLFGTAVAAWLRHNAAARNAVP